LSTRSIHLISSKEIGIESLLSLIRDCGIDSVCDPEFSWWRIRGEAESGREDVFVLSQDVALTFYEDARLRTLCSRIGTPRNLFAFDFWRTKTLFCALQAIERGIRDVEFVVDTELDEFLSLREWIDALEAEPPESWKFVDKTTPQPGDYWISTDPPARGRYR
jgi:hypothetical protein